MHVDMPKLGIYLVEYKSNQLWLYMIVVLDYHDNNSHLRWWSNESCNATRAGHSKTTKLDKIWFKALLSSYSVMCSPWLPLWAIQSLPKNSLSKAYCFSTWQSFLCTRQVTTWTKYRDQGRQNPDPAGTYQALWFYEYESILAHALCCWSPLGKFYHWSKQASKQVHLPLRALQLYILYRICRHSTDPEWSDGTFVISLLGIYK